MRAEREHLAISRAFNYLGPLPVAGVLNPRDERSRQWEFWQELGIEPLTEPEGDGQTLTEPGGDGQNLTEPEGDRQTLTEPEGDKQTLTEPGEKACAGREEPGQELARAPAEEGRAAPPSTEASGYSNVVVSESVINLTPPQVGTAISMAISRATSMQTSTQASMQTSTQTSTQASTTTSITASTQTSTKTSTRIQGADSDLLSTTTQPSTGSVSSASISSQELPAVVPARPVIDGKYRLHAMVGEGGMGTVYRVRHLLLGKDMALKTFRASSISPTAWKRFQREVQAIARLNHNNIVQVYDFGICPGNVPYFTMELLRGQSLAEKLRIYGRMSLEAALPVFRAVASALAHAHKHDIVHRDIKPGNIFLDQSTIGHTVVKVVDFGLAKLAYCPDREGQHLTAGRGLIFGSPLYMSPEQATAKETDLRTDVYSFGCTFFEALTGRPPFLGASAFDTIQMHVYESPPMLVEACKKLELNEKLEEIMRRLLAKDVDERYQSFDEILRDLKTLDEEPAPAVPDPVIEPLFVTAKAVTAELPAGPLPGTLIGTGAFGLLALMMAIMTLIFAPKMQEISTGSSFTAPIISGVIKPLTQQFCYSEKDRFGQRRLIISPDLSLGYITWPGGPLVPARGLVILPRDKQLRLEVSEELSCRPELLANFKPDEFAELALRDFTEWSFPFLDKATRHLTGLQGLDISGCRIGNEAVAPINRLHNLHTLTISDTRITGEGLLKLDRLRQLASLEMSQTQGVSVVLNALRGSREIKSLLLEECCLTDNDIQAITTMPNIAYLDLNHNALSNRSVARLAALEKLSSLQLSDTALSSDCVDSLKHLKNLQCLRLDIDSWDLAKIAHLKTLLPSDCVLCGSKTYNKMREVFLETCFAPKAVVATGKFVSASQSPAK